MIRDRRQMTEEDIKQLLYACLKNDRKAQHVLFKITYSAMFNICMRYAKDEDEAKDMLNEGYMKIFSNLQNYEEKGMFDAWMKRVMVNSALDYQRKYKTMIDNVHYQSLSDSMIGKYDENQAVSNLSADELMCLIQGLPSMSKNVFNLYVFEGYSHKEIASLLNIKEGTSHWHLNFARNTLKNRILKLNKISE